MTCSEQRLQLSETQLTFRTLVALKDVRKGFFIWYLFMRSQRAWDAEAHGRKV